MKKIVAVFTQKGSLSKGIDNNTTVNLFTLENNQVAGVENIKLEKESSNVKLSLMLSLKKVSTIYLHSINNELKNILNKINIKTILKDDIDDIENDSFINRFIFD